MSNVLHLIVDRYDGIIGYQTDTQFKLHDRERQCFHTHQKPVDSQQKPVDSTPNDKGEHNDIS